MDAVLSFLGQCAWPALVGAMLLVGRKELILLLQAVRSRVERGDEFSAGPSGVKILRSVAGRSGGEEGERDEGGDEDTNGENPGFYLVHVARRDRTLDDKGYEHYRLNIHLENEPGTDLDDVLKVVYHLHPDFPRPDLTVADSSTAFELRITAWGQFYMTADVYLKDRDAPLQLDRYLNF